MCFILQDSFIHDVCALFHAHIFSRISTTIFVRCWCAFIDSVISGSEAASSFVSCMHAPSDLQSTLADRRARDYQFFIADDDEQREREEQVRAIERVNI